MHRFSRFHAPVPSHERLNQVLRPVAARVITDHIIRLNQLAITAMDKLASDLERELLVPDIIANVIRQRAVFVERGPESILHRRKRTNRADYRQRGGRG